MEKVNIRSSVSKPNATELNKKQDGSSKYNRYPRFKSDNASPRPEARVKPNPQKSRETIDKRPRTRGGAVCERYRNEITTDVYGNGQKSKKVNLNHLLNFTVSPVDCNASRRSAQTHRVKLPKYNKEKFLQANCQFIARDDGDYSLQSRNPDNLVDWSLVEEVRVPSRELPSCPICLFTPVAAKITRCGHIYCWPCMLHYLALTDRTWQKCPICFEAIHKMDLRSVVSVTQASVNVGSVLTMRLMKREKGLMFPVPAAYECATSVYKIHDDESVTKYQKLLLANRTEIHNIIARERYELDNLLITDKDEPEACFITSAMELLREREELLKQYGQAQSNRNTSEDCYNPYMIESMQSPTKDITQEVVKAKLNDNDVSPMGSLGTTPYIGHQFKGKGAFYFYQSEDGQNIYLHGLNAKMLIREFGSLEESPRLIEGRVLELENISMTEAVRNRHRYLQHLPLTCEFQVAELNLDKVLSKTTIDEFSGEVVKRCRMRNKKAQEERKRERYIEEVENKKYGKYPSATYSLSSPDQFPVCVSHELSDPSEEYEVQYPCFGVSSLSISENEEKSELPVASFAEMLRDGHTTSSKCTPSYNRNIQNFSKGVDSDEESATAIPEYRESFSNAFQAAFDAAVCHHENSGSNVTSKKKKKFKNRVLFSTSMNRN